MMAVLSIGSLAELLNLIISGLSVSGPDQKVVASVIGLCVAGLVFVVAPLVFGALIVRGRRWPRWVLSIIVVVAISVQTWAIVVGAHIRVLTVVFTVALTIGAILAWIAISRPDSRSGGSTALAGR